VKGNAKEVLSAIEKEELNCIKSRGYFHLLGKSDKGKAAAILRDLYSRKFGRITTLGVGDSPDDLPMLKIVDKPFLVRKTPSQNASYIVWRKILTLVTKLVNTEDKSLTTQFSSS
jgi:mannosyl-3-phosphoglycerate phosphatase